MSIIYQYLTLGQATDLYHRKLKSFQLWMALRSSPRYKPSPMEEDRYQKAGQTLKELADYLWENGVNVYT